MLHEITYRTHSGFFLQNVFFLKKSVFIMIYFNTKQIFKFHNSGQTRIIDYNTYHPRISINYSN